MTAGLFLFAILLLVLLGLWGVHLCFLNKGNPSNKKVLKTLYKMAYETTDKNSKVSVFQLLYKVKMQIHVMDSILKQFEKDGIIKREKEKISFTSFGKQYYDTMFKRKGK